MPVDEDKLETIISDLTASLEQDDDLRIQKRQVLQNLREIQMRAGESQPDEEEPPTKIMPINVRSNKPYTIADRDRQYADNITRAESILSE